MSYQFTAASNQYLEANSSPGGITTYPLTVSMAVKITTDIDMGFFWLGNSAAANQWISVLSTDTTANYFLAQTRNTLTTAFAAGTTDPATKVGVWTHIAGVFVAADSRLVYVNGGTAEGTNATSQNAPTLNRVSIGHFGDSTPALPADAQIAYCAVWSADLSEAEIGQVHGGTDPRDVDGANLAELWDFSSLTPLVGLINGLTLTATNGPTIGTDNPELSWLARTAGPKVSSMGWPWHFFRTG